MNPVCETDIFSPRCQEWMREVCSRCRDLFTEATTDVWAAWWHDTTAPLYKDVNEMTVYDCEKLKHLLEVKVAARSDSSNKIAVEYKEFAWWQKMALIIIYIAILVLLLVVCRRWRKPCQLDNQPPIDSEREEVQLHTSTSKSERPIEHCKPDETGTIPKDCPKKKHGFKAWMHQVCRPIFVHNEGALKRRQKKYEDDKRLERVLNERNIKKWTKTRSKPERKRETETKENKQTIKKGQNA